MSENYRPEKSFFEGHKSSGAEVPTSESTIDYNIRRLEEGLSRYSELVDMLASKIDRVLTPDFESEKLDMNAIPDPGNSGLGSNIGSKAIRVETVNERLQNLIRRVDL